MSTSAADLLAVSEQLDPPNRALMNLWLRRQLDDVAIARLAGGTPQEVAVRRERLLEALAAQVDVPPADVRAALAQLQASPLGPAAAERQAATGVVMAASAAAPATAPEPVVAAAAADPPPASPALVRPGPVSAEPPPPPQPESEPRPQREPGAAAKRPAAAPLPSSLLVAVGLCLAVMVALAALTGGGDPAPAEDEASAPAARSRPAPVPVQPPAGGSAGGSGTLTVEGDRMVVSVAGLQRPPSDYVVWLFNSVADAEPLGRLDEVSFPIPRGVERFSSVDVSLETDDDPGHSGRSVARMPAPSAGGE